jgi:hypothetical protein
MRGVVDNNTFTGFTYPTRPATGYLYGGPWWDNWEGLVFGKPDNNIYFEDNIFTGVVGVSDCQEGNRYAFRYNTITTAIEDSYPLFDLHGNAIQAYSSFGAEIYGNQITAGPNPKGGTFGVATIDHRGGKVVVFLNNNDSTIYARAKVREEFNDALRPTTNSQPQHVSDSYYWHNMNNGARLIEIYVGATVDYGAPLGLVPQENREFWQEKTTAFDGTTGVGVGPLANRPATCTPGVAYWATEQDYADIKNYIGAHPKTPISGVLYRCSSSNVWEKYFEPLPYPHPLRLTGPVADDNTQTLPLVAGWNWISFNVLPNDLSLNSVFSDILDKVEQVKSQTQSAIRIGGAWKGDLADMNGIGAYKMYKVKVSSACTLTATGTAIASTTQISLVTGWNWVAYLPTTAISITTALDSIKGQVLQIKSLTKQATYSGGAWTGTLTQLDPGQGYAIKMSGPGNLIYTNSSQINFNKR